MTSGSSHPSPEHLDGIEALSADPERRKQMEDLARELSGDRPRWRVLERVRALLRRRRRGSRGASGAPEGPPAPGARVPPRE